MNHLQEVGRFAPSITGRVAAAFLSLVSLHPAYGAEAPSIRVTVNSPGWITVDWTHTGQDVESFLVQREQPAYTWVFRTHAGVHTDKGLTADTVYRYRVCADYGATTECSEWLAARTMPPQAPTAPHPKPPPEFVPPGEAFHEPSRIRIRWKKTGDYERVIVRWRHKTGAGESQADVDSSAPEGSYEVVTPLPGTYVFILKGCTLNFVGAANCGDWSAPFEVSTASEGVARVDCTPGTLKAGSPRFTANGRAEYHFENPIPTYNTPAGVCLGPERTVVASYLVHGTWNPNAQPGAWDSSGANATESFTMTFGEEFSADRAPRRPLPPGTDPTATIAFLARAHCDRDPWLNPTATCRRTGDNVPQDVRAKWPALVTEPFPHSRSAIPPPDRARLLTQYNRLNAQLVGTAPSGSRALEHAGQRRPDDQDLRNGQLQQPRDAAPGVAPGTCRPGYVWREAYPGDLVCVTPETRAQASRDNEEAAARRQPGGGAYGPETCRPGYVWRVARPEDLVCVTPETRDQAAADNRQAAARRVGAEPVGGPTPAPAAPAGELGPAREVTLPAENARCRSYAQRAVDQYLLTTRVSRCRVRSDGRWNDRYQGHHQWCLTAADDALRAEERARDEHLLGCGGQTRID